MSPNVNEILAQLVDARFTEEAEFLRSLVRLPSDNPPGDCAAHAGRTAELLEALGFTVERYPVDDQTVRSNGMVSAVNLIVRRRFGHGPVVALNAHGDVVPPGDGWTTDPYGAEIRDGWLYGRGAAVSKSDFATYAFAVLALGSAVDRGVALAGTVEIHLTYDEEAGGAIGPKWLIERGLTKPDLALSAGFSYGVVTAHNGCLHLEVTVRGKSAHAARPDTGHDALEAATAVLGTLYAHRQELSSRRSAIEGIGSPTLTVGIIEGGINTNVVPDRVRLRLDRRIIPEERVDDVEPALRARISRAVAGRAGITVGIERIMLARPLAALAGFERLAEPLARHASEVLRTEVGSQGVPLYTDARHYAEAGIPTVLYGAGPRTLTEANAHRANERVRLSDLKAATLVVARGLAEVLSVPG